VMHEFETALVTELQINVQRGDYVR